MTTLPSDMDAGQREGSRRWLVVAVAGVALLAIAAIVLIALFLRNIGGYGDWPEDSAVPRDGAGHVVEVDAGETFYIWAYVNFSDVDCQVADGRIGDAVELRKPVKHLIRNGGAVYFEALLGAVAPSDQVTVTCAAAGDHEPVYVDALNGPAVVDDLGPKWPIPAGLAGLGVALLVVAGGMRVLRRS